MHETTNKTTFTLPSDTQVEMTRVFEAPRQLVFDCWTKPEHMRQWFGGRRATVTTCEIDARPGGTYRYVFTLNDGTEMGLGGVFSEVAAPERLVFTEVFDMWPDHVGDNVMTLTEQDSRTTLVITSTYDSKETRDAILATGMEEGAAESMDVLDEYLAGLAGGHVIFNISMSLDGFVAGPNDEVDEIFRWYFAGDTVGPVATPGFEFKIAKASADLLSETWPQVGAIVDGRRIFDLAQAWGGKPPLGVPHYVMTHNPPAEWTKEGSPFTFVTDGVESAITQAKAAAGDKDVVISTPNVLHQALKAGLVDEIAIDLVHVLLGAGIRCFEHLGIEPLRLERTALVEGTGVTHLRFRVIK